MSQSSLTSTTAQVSLFADEWTSLLAVSPAKTSAPPVKDEDLPGRAAASGLKCLELSRSSDRAFASLRTSLLCALEGLTGYSLIWKRLATPQGRSWSALGRSAHRTNEIESGSSLDWRTPQANPDNRSLEALAEQREIQQARYEQRKAEGRATGGPPGMMTLGQQVQMDWPTATVCGNHNRKGASANSGDGLLTAVKSWPTPNAADADRKGADYAKAARRSGGDDLQTAALKIARDWPTARARDWKGQNQRGQTKPYDALPNAVIFNGNGPPDPANSSTNGKRPASLRLNPAFVESLMGYEVGWTDVTESPA